MNQKGFAPILIALGILLIVGIAGGAYYFGTLKNTKPQSQNSVVVSQTPQPKPSPTPSVTPQQKNIVSNPTSCVKQDKIHSTAVSSTTQSGITREEASRIIPLHPSEINAQVTEGKISVKWSGTGEDGTEYLVCRRDSSSSDWQVIGNANVIGDNHGDYRLEDISFKPNTSYIYGVRFIGNYGNYSQITESSSVIAP